MDRSICQFMLCGFPCAYKGRVLLGHASPDANLSEKTISVCLLEKEGRYGTVLLSTQTTWLSEFPMILSIQKKKKRFIWDMLVYFSFGGEIITGLK